MKLIKETLLAQTTCSIFEIRNKTTKWGDGIWNRKKKRSRNFTVESEQWNTIWICGTMCSCRLSLFRSFSSVFGYFFFIVADGDSFPFWFFCHISSISNPIVIAVFLFDLNLYEKHFMAWSFLLDIYEWSVAHYK